jgi:hypothetical protein
MNDWLKRQLTEITAWAGFFVVLAALFAPRWVLVAIGVLLICWDDQSAAAWVRKQTEKLTRSTKDDGAP